MSNKLIAAIVIVTVAIATIPSYLSGYFAHQTLKAQLNLITQPYADSVEISSTTSVPGFYGSSYGYDVSLNLNSPRMAALKQQLAGNTLNFHVDNQLSHGFFSVGIVTTVSGQLKDSFDQLLEKWSFVPGIEHVPLLSLISDARFSVTGNYHLSSILSIQGFSVTTSNADHDVITITTNPTILTANLTQENITITTSYDTVAVKMPDSTINFNQLTLDGMARYAQPDNEIPTQLGNQNLKLTLASINMTGDSEQVDVLNDLAWGFNVTFKNGRAFIANDLQLNKVGNPLIPQTQIEDVTLDISLDMGIKAAKDYYQAVQKMDNNPRDEAATFALFSNIVTEDINLTFNRIKAKTFTGPLNIDGNINLAAVDADQFIANPALALGSLKYAMQGEMPKKLLLMTGQLPVEFVDNLLQQEMILLNGEQVSFKLTGEAGHVNLNGKPLM